MNKISDRVSYRLVKFWNFVDFNISFSTEYWVSNLSTLWISLSTYWKVSNLLNFRHMLVFDTSYLDSQFNNFFETLPVCRLWHHFSNGIQVNTLEKIRMTFFGLPIKKLFSLFHPLRCSRHRISKIRAPIFFNIH